MVDVRVFGRDGEVSGRLVSAREIGEKMTRNSRRRVMLLIQLNCEGRKDCCERGKESSRLCWPCLAEDA